MKYLIALTLITLLFISGCKNDPDINSLNKSKSLLIEGEQDSLDVTLKYGEETTINENVKIKFKGVTSDSRCPIDAICVWAGNAAAELEITTQDDQFTTTLNTSLSPMTIWAKGVLIEIKDLNPYPKSQIEIKPEEYVILLFVKLTQDIPVENYVKLIDGNDTSKINTDPLYLNSGSLVNDNLSLSLSYGGGCKNHFIELYAYKAIEKTNPPRVSIRLSHDSNEDMCEAYVTRNIEFDLRALKEYLINNYNIVNGVNLVLYDTEGKPMDKIFEYTFPQ